MNLKSNIPDLGDLATPLHAIVSVNKLFKLFIPFIMTYFVVNMDVQQYNILNKTKTIAL
jgi:hypothetical protein